MPCSAIMECSWSIVGVFAEAAVDRPFCAARTMSSGEGVSKANGLISEGVDDLGAIGCFCLGWDVDLGGCLVICNQLLISRLRHMDVVCPSMTSHEIHFKYRTSIKEMSLPISEVVELQAHQHNRHRRPTTLLPRNQSIHHLNRHHHSMLMTFWAPF